MIRGALSIPRHKSAAVKLYDYKGLSPDFCSRNLPITNPIFYHGMTYDNQAFVLSHGVDKFLTPKNNEYPSLPQGASILKAKYYRGSDGEKELLVAYDTINGGTLVMDMSKFNDEYAWQKVFAVNMDHAEEFRIDGKNVLVMIIGSIIFTYDGEEFKQVLQLSQGKVQNMCNHFGRMFFSEVINPYRLYFSDEEDPFDFSVTAFTGGHINLDIDYGKLLKIISMNEYLYLIMESGVMRLRAYGDQSEFQLKKLDVFTGDIVKGTIERVGNKIVFLSSAGLMVFDGYSCASIFEEIKAYLLRLVGNEKTVVNVCSCNNSYYLSALTKGDDTQIFVADFKKNNYTFVKTGNLNGMATISQNGEQLILFNGHRSDFAPIEKLKLLSDNASKQGELKVDNIDCLTPDKTKVIKNIVCPQGFSGSIIIDNHQERPRRFELRSQQTTHVNMCGKLFDITLTINGKKTNYSPTVYIDMEG